ncbi:MAG: hypothetical protein MRJ93_13755 [Nitrososphaeraceae archaeon]|nr:hypothetical protein [Nitrososphaeraceae archaeon]
MKSKNFQILKSVSLASVAVMMLVSFYALSNIVENNEIDSLFGVNNSWAEIPINENIMVFSENEDFKIKTLGSNAFDECLLSC